MKNFALFALLLLSLPPLHAQQCWKAVLAGVNLPVNLTQTISPEGDEQWLFYSPSQTSRAYPASATRRGDTLRLSVKSLGAKMTLAVSESRLSGTFRQGFFNGAVDFVPADSLWSFPRPQTPLPPYRFEERQLQVTHRANQGEKVSLSATLTLPRDGNAPYPAVVLVSGSGAQNRDEEIFSHKPFLVIADYFASRGIAVLRYDDRGTGQSSGSFADATTFDFADDAEAMFKALRKQSDIDPRRVGLIGHSEGGTIAPIVASRNKNAAFIILMAGPGADGTQVLLEQNQRIFALQGVSQRLIDVRIDVMKDLIETSRTLPADQCQKAFDSIIALKTAGLSIAERDSIGLNKAYSAAARTQFSQPWMRTFLSLDPAPYLAKTRCPILALNGTMDCQVLPQNLDGVATATDHRAETVLLPGLNHLFQHCLTGGSDEYLFIEETIAPEVLKAMADWILAH